MRLVSTYRLYAAIILVFISMTAFAQSEQYVVEIHISDAKAEIYVDGKSIGSGKNLYQPKLTTGKHTITATRPSYTEVSKIVKISSSSASRIIILASPKPIYGYIQVISSPGPIEIELDGKKTGTYTPHLFDSILIGTHSVMLKYEGYESERRTFNVKEADTVRLDVELAKKQERKPTQYTSTYSGYNSGYSSGRSSYSSSSNSGSFSSSYSSSYSSNNSTSYKSKSRDKHDFHVYYFGFGSGIITCWELQASLFDFRYKWFEVRPCLWGINLPFVQNISHTKLPAAIVNPNPMYEFYGYEPEYSMSVPERGVQIFYAPMVRFHIPVKETKAIVLGAGPQISWTKFSWKGRTQGLSKVDNYVFYDSNNPIDKPTGLQKDAIWFTAEIAFLWNFDWGSDIDIFARYQDGFYIGFEYRIGREY